MDEREGIAGIKLLVAIAKADGELRFEERRALEFALDGLKLPDGHSIDALVDGEIDVDAELAKITSPEGRAQVHQIAESMASVDGEMHSAEAALLDRMRTAFGIPKPGVVTDVLSEAKDTLLLSNIRAIDDPERRAAEIQEDTLKYAIMSAVLGAFPLPGLAIATDLAVVGLQAKLVRDVGQYWGHTMDGPAVKSLLGGIVGGAGVRIAVNQLVKLVPGWGSVFGATTSFASTWAVGKVADRYFASGAKLSPEELGKEFTTAKKAGEGAYKENKAVVEAKAKANKSALEELHDAYKSGKVEQAEYDRRIAELV